MKKLQKAKKKITQTRKRKLKLGEIKIWYDYCPDKTKTMKGLFLGLSGTSDTNDAISILDKRNMQITYVPFSVVRMYQLPAVLTKTLAKDDEMYR